MKRLGVARSLATPNAGLAYFYKWGMATNGFGIPLHIRFLDNDFYNQLPNDFNSVEDAKYAFDNASLHPVLSGFHKRIGKSPFTTFLGDSELDSYDNYGFLHQLGYEKVLIPINERNTPPDNAPIPVNSSGIPCCPKDNSQTFISNGRCKGKNRNLLVPRRCADANGVSGFSRSEKY